MTLKKEVPLTNEEKQLAHAEQMLHSFGLSLNEAKIYVYLLERGTDTGGSKIAVGTKLHRQYVYLTLPRLIQLGLIEEVPYGKLNKYKAVAPTQIAKIAKKRVAEADDIVKTLEQFSKVGHEQDFEVLVGAKAIQKYEYDWVLSVKEHEDQYIIGGNTKGFADLMGETLNEYLVSETRKRITTYYLGHTSEKALWYSTIIGEQDLQLKFLEKLPQGATHMVIRRETVLFYSFLNPPLLYVIKSPIVAKNYEDFFMMLWDMAGESGEKKDK